VVFFVEKLKYQPLLLRFLATKKPAITSFLMKLLLSALLLLIGTTSFSQLKARDEENPETLDSRIYDLKPGSDTSSLKFPFEKIEVIDRRFDTTKIGYALKLDLLRARKRAFVKMRLKNDLSGSVQKFYNDTYQKNFSKTGYELFIVIKTLWISAMPVSSLQHTKESVEKSDIDIRLKFEYYLKKGDQYIPLKRIDTAFQVLKSDTTNEEQDSKIKFLGYCLKRMIENPDYSSYISSLEKRPGKTLQQIEIFNSKRCDIPILKDSLKKGIYLTFEEFRNNTPSILNFTKKLIVNKNVFLTSDEIPIRHFWGYYDGINIGYGTSGNDILFRTGNTFQLFTLEGVFRRVSLDLGALAISPVTHLVPLPGSIEKAVWCPKELDMETGELY